MKKVEKGQLHKKNPHRGKYDFDKLAKDTNGLKAFIKKNPRGEDTIDFSNPEAVVMLNRALLKTYYNIDNWQIPKGFLCPPIPGRADYIHYIAELLDGKSGKVKVLDIGTGSNLIYPIIGSQSYKWEFVAVDIDPISVENAKGIIRNNEVLSDKVEVKLQKNRKNIFEGIITKGEYFDLTMCNPPFHKSLEDAMKANRRKVNNLNKNKGKKVKEKLNFGGQKAELWCPGGELKFLKDMVRESKKFAKQVGWFTTLVSNKDNIRPLKQMLKKVEAKEVKVLEMSQGQKISRVLAWRY